jgi:protoheme IX farnesyltransferase
MPGLVRASHPEPAATVTAVATLLAVAADRPPAEVGCIAAAVLCGQLSIGWCNDWIDAPRDRAVGRGDKPLVTGEVSRRVVGIGAVVSVSVSVALSLLLWPSGWFHVAALAGAWLYNRPLKKTPLSVLPFAVSFGLLVPFAFPDAGWRLFAVGALLGSAAHFANVLPDLADDAVTGVRGLPHRLGHKGSLIAALTLLSAATILLGSTVPGGWWLLPIVVAVIAAARLAKVAAFQLVQLIALADVVLLLLAAYAW